MNSNNFVLFISLVLPDEGLTINRKLAGKCSSYTPNPFPDVISQIYESLLGISIVSTVKLKNGHTFQNMENTFIMSLVLNVFLLLFILRVISVGKVFIH